MLTDKKMQQIAERYLQKIGEGSIEAIIYSDDTIKSPMIIFILMGEFKYSLGGNVPFLVEKETGRVITFGTAGILEDYIKAYERKTLYRTLDRYWYPDEDRFNYQ
ncbi:hypothetical protein DRF65_02085 [Chryseobacterium pennae]|uniref:Immunity protein 35 domain-containing protein n=1 Tax=Chryseobacterium pennae TaxID=2258962 RepID=A0A3D9CF55_9FLAO|nr:hypothetical protein [Chryseobacterium pennae]REC64384.1 hypothetical protein DRF65_02085 [Chryseobacterium pennae]